MDSGKSRTSALTTAERPATPPRRLSTWLSPRDAIDLFYRCLVAPDVGFTVVYGASANQRGWWELDSAERLDYRPVDDAELWASEVEATDLDGVGRGPSRWRVHEWMIAAYWHPTPPRLALLVTSFLQSQGPPCGRPPPAAVLGRQRPRTLSELTQSDSTEAPERPL
jgi:hypothetical protein